MKLPPPPPPLPKWTQCYSETTPAPWINEKEGEFPYQLMKMDGIRFYEYLVLRF